MVSSSKAKILHVSEVLATGILEFIYSLVTEIDAYEHIIVYRVRELGHDDYSIRKLFPPNVKLIKWKSVDRPIHLVNDTKAALELFGHIKSVNPDIIHLHSSKAGILGRIVSPFTIGRNSTIYTPNGAPFARTDVSSKKQKIYELCERFANICAGQVICVSQSESNIYKSVNISSTYINNGVRIQNNQLVFEKDHSNLPIKIVSSGRITNQKNPTAFNNIAKHFLKNKNVEFIWIGDGKKKSQLDSPNITITGWISKDEVFKRLSSASLYLSTALWEGLPFSVLEAMSLGLPVVISNCIGNEDLIEHGKSGFIYNDIPECTSYIDRFINNPDQISTMGKDAWIRCEKNFSRKRMAENYEAAYDKLLVENFSSKMLKTNKSLSIKK